MNESFFRALASAVDNSKPREQRARDGVRMIREARSYHWVGVFDVGDDDCVIVAQTGAVSTEHPRFTAMRILSAEAVRTRTTVVRNDRTGSEMVLPILGAESAIAIGTLDVQSNRSEEFEPGDVAFLEECAAVLRPLYD